MFVDNRLSKVTILIQQNKLVEAERLLKDMLSGDSTNISVIALLAEVNLQQGKYDVATTLVGNAIALSPDTSHLFSIRSRIFLQQERIKEAEEAINHAIYLEPDEADYFALLAHINLVRKQFAEALENANIALDIDPENLLALNTRSTALNKLNRKEESYATIEGALRTDPNNAYTHANYGWGLLEKGDHKKALVHFAEALKVDPNNSYAQAGMMEALKASNVVYRGFLKYSFWMGNLTAKYQWGVIIGFYVIYRGLQSLAQFNENLRPFLTPLLIALTLFAFSTWIITPISNLFLRFNKYGQILLSKKQKISSNLVAGSLALFLAGVLLYFALSDERYLAIAGFGFAMMLPFSMMFNEGKPKNAFMIYAVAMSVIGLAAISIAFATGELLNPLSTIFIFGFIGFQWFANFLMIKRSNF